MRIFIDGVTDGRSDTRLFKNSNKIVNYVCKAMEDNNFQSSFDELWISFWIPPTFILKNVGVTPRFIDSYTNDKFPRIRTNRKYKTIDIVLRAPEFSIFIEKDLDYEMIELEIEEKFKNISEIEAAHTLISKFKIINNLIKSKLRTSDTFDYEILDKILDEIDNTVKINF